MLRLDESASLFSLPIDGSFPCLVWDEGGAWSAERKTVLARELIQRGCRYAVCGGAAADTWHLAFDLAFVEEYLDAPAEARDANHVMTTSHEGESPDEVAFFFARNTNFDHHDFGRFVVLRVGDPADGAEVAERVEHWLSTDGAT